MTLNKTIVTYIKKIYPAQNPVLLHCPEFLGNEKKYLAECIDTKYVSYVGHFVADMENKIKEITGAEYAVAIVNGTAALHILLLVVGIKPGDEIITQSLSFAATAAAIVHAGGTPVFVDVERETLGMSPESLKTFLLENTEIKDCVCINKKTGSQIKAVIPMHTFGHPVRIDEIQKICDEYCLLLIEDAAESLGSFYQGKHTGTFGKAGILSFNGNKLVTTGGGGMLITDDEVIANRVRYLSTTAKRPHRWEFYHDEVGYNLRMPSVNAAIGLAQLEYFDRILANKKETAILYQQFFDSISIKSVIEPDNSKSNYWLNAILFEDRQQRDEFLEYSNDNDVQTRPAWNLLHTLPPYQHCLHTDTPNAEYFVDCLVNIPSSVRV
ncbi:MAG: LegC family aminotransferase [Bacteroidales bacterium]|jgi:aminotransferase in exopolysaccharide biosynthesis|nr:LegC family aminotransferase [Bacteroidales bacterium]